VVEVVFVESHFEVADLAFVFDKLFDEFVVEVHHAVHGVVQQLASAFVQLVDFHCLPFDRLVEDVLVGFLVDHHILEVDLVPHGALYLADQRNLFHLLQPDNVQ